jgi:hypothetical protein
MREIIQADCRAKGAEFVADTAAKQASPAVVTFFGHFGSEIQSQSAVSRKASRVAN